MVYTKQLIKLNKECKKKIKRCKRNKEEKCYIYLGVLVDLDNCLVYKIIVRNLEKLGIDYNSNKVFKVERISLDESKSIDIKVRNIIREVKEKYKGIDLIEV